jgi:hypothetical protein
MPPLRRWLTVLCALAAAAAFALAVQGSAWWSIGDDVGIGTIASRHCYGDGICQRGGLGWTSGSTTWVRAGAATYAAGMVAMLVLVALAGALAARTTGQLAARVAAVATVTASIVAIVFVTSRPALPGATVGRGLPLFVAGVGLGLVAIVATLWRRQPAGTGTGTGTATVSSNAATPS